MSQFIFTSTPVTCPCPFSATHVTDEIEDTDPEAPVTNIAAELNGAEEDRDDVQDADTSQQAHSPEHDSDDDIPPGLHVLVTMLRSKRDTLAQARARLGALKTDNTQMVAQLSTGTQGPLNRVTTLLEQGSRTQQTIASIARNALANRAAAEAHAAQHTLQLSDELAAIQAQIDVTEATAQELAEAVHAALLFREQGQFMNAQRVNAAQAKLAHARRTMASELEYVTRMTEEARERRRAEREQHVRAMQLADVTVCFGIFDEHIM